MTTTEQLYSVLLIYEYVPENTAIFYFKVKLATYERMLRCHDLLINMCGLNEEQEEDLQWLYKITENANPIFTTKINPDSPVFQYDEDMEVDNKKPIPDNIVNQKKKHKVEISVNGSGKLQIIYSGFIL